MRTLLAICAASLIAAGPALGGRPIEQTIFVTGSLIPQRIKLKPIGTTTVSPVRIIDRREIDATGRRTTRAVLIADPSVSAAGR